jgi:hypothetical protein
MGDVGTSDLVCITLAREVGWHVDMSWGKVKAKDPRILIEASQALRMENKQSILPFHSYSTSFPPPPPTITSTKASKISLSLLIRTDG